jgi:hypothetical protein
LMIPIFLKRVLFLGESVKSFESLNRKSPFSLPVVGFLTNQNCSFENL